MTNVAHSLADEVRGELGLIKKENNRLRDRVGALSDQITALKEELHITQQKVQQDMRGLFENVQKTQETLTAISKDVERRRIL